MIDAMLGGLGALSEGVRVLLTTGGPNVIMLQWPE